VQGEIAVSALLRGTVFQDSGLPAAPMTVYNHSHRKYSPTRRAYPTETDMELWINRLLVGCGSLAGLLLGTGNAAAGIALAIIAICAASMMRVRAGASQEG
jgi:hypothetical protein